MTLGTRGRIACVRVSPDGASITRTATASGLSETFWVVNESPDADSYDLSCTNAPGTCTGLSQTSLSLDPGDSAQVTVYYNTGAPGSGVLELMAVGTVSGTDWGTYNVALVAPSVTVTPKNLAGPNRAPNSTGNVETFWITNNGGAADTYAITCWGTSGITCTGTSQTSVALGGGTQTTVTATYSVGGAGSGQLWLKALGAARDSGSYVVMIGAPNLDLTPQNAGYRAGMCSPGCFDVGFRHATPAYFSLGAARSFAVIYNSATARPTPVVMVNVSSPGAPYPTHYSLQVRKAGVFLTLLNGANIVYYVAGSSQTSRLAAALDAIANGLTTGAYDVDIVVTSYYSGGPNLTTTVASRLLVVDHTKTPYGIGVNVAGLMRLFFGPGSSVLLTGGDGSAAFYRRDCPSCSFVTPGGTSASLAQTGSTYRLTDINGSYVDFASTGRMLRAVDRFGNRDSLIWTDTLLTRIRDPMGKDISLLYTGGKLISATDPAPRVTNYTINTTTKLLTRIIDPDGRQTGFAYTGNLLTADTNRAGGVTKFTYDSLRRAASDSAPSIALYSGGTGRPTTVFVPAERVVWQLGVAGTSTGTAKANIRADTVKATVTDPLGVPTRFTLDRFGAATSIAGPYGQTATITRDTMGRPLVTTAPTGHIVRTSYTGYLLTQWKDSTTGRVINYAYNGSNDPTVTSGDVVRLEYTYHNGTQGPTGALNGELVGIGTPVVTQHRPDSRGRDTLVVDNLSHASRDSFDLTWGGSAKSKDARGNVTRRHFDAAGRPDSIWIPTQGVWTFTYDSLNRQRQVKNPLGQVTQYIYGPLTLDRVIDPKGQVYKFAYNALGMLVARHDLGDTTKADTLKYDLGGNLRTVRTRRGDVVSMTYDSVGRLVSRSGPDFPVDSFKYDPTGHWTVSWNTNGRDSLAYDNAGRLVTSLQTNVGFNHRKDYTFDIRNRLTLREDNPWPFHGWNPAGVIGGLRIYYDTASGAVDSTCSSGVCEYTIQDPELLPGTRQLFLEQDMPNALVIGLTRTRNATHEASSDTINVARLDTLFGGSWTYDSLNRLANEDKNATGYGGTMRYTYDALGRLVNYCVGGGGSWTWSYGLGWHFVPNNTCKNEYGVDTSAHMNAYAYDAAANRQDSAATATIGVGNRVTAFKGYTIMYDVNGNTLTKYKAGADSFSYAWDAVSRLKEVRNHGTLVASFAYDALGRRVAKTTPTATERYVFDGSTIVLDVDGSNQFKAEYGYSPSGLLTSRNPTWTGIVLTDPMIGTIRGIADAGSGVLRESYFPTSWGEVDADTGIVTRFRMGGQEYDQETRLYHLGARYYDPQLGRFISEDPIGIAGGLNLYAYAGDDPVNGSDPTGLCHAGIHGHGDTLQVCEDDPWSVPGLFPYNPGYDCDLSGCHNQDWDGTYPQESPRSLPPRDVGSEAVRKCQARGVFLVLSAAADALLVISGYEVAVLGFRAGRIGLYAALRSADGIGLRTAEAHAARRVAYGVGMRSDAIAGEAGEALVGAVMGQTSSRLSDVGVQGLAGDEPSLKDAIPFVGTGRAYGAWKRACFHPGE